MKKAVKLLILLNLMNYISNFVFAFMYSYNKIAVQSNVMLEVVWLLSPYVFLIATSFILATDYKEEYKTFKVEAIIDWFIRLVSCCVVFQEFNFKFLSSEYIIQQAILVSLFIINIYLEYKMYKKAKKYILIKKEDIAVEKISEEEKQNIRAIGKAATLGVSSFFIFAGLGMGVTQIMDIDIKLLRVFIIFVSICTFIWFLTTNYRKCYLFYLDKSLAKRIFIRDALYAALGYIMILIAAFGLFGNTLLASAVEFIGILLLYPTIRTNRKIGIRYKKVKDILGENFYLYFNCKEKNL
ncbi:hypothetical protein [Clostridium estertheticum]|uniref:hypothetical protein n=1 Tax=Clostridium estertheticum TaxID=238834 RepID=UPI001C0E0AE4|nr:hypothetical protein [Clostridium estertheticum]MBU3075863.1 hypothetical protein [Clostridium estertheticum]MBU3166021.1 hypothetical protein [Clostridium estertheticum]MBU3171845.1 hypothetical protein [Clostridium estertheticum]